MPKTFQDVVPPGRRSIRNVPITSVRRKKNMPPEEEPAFRNEAREPELIVQHSYEEPREIIKEKRKFSSGKVFAALALLVIAGFIFGMMTAFTSASIDIVPKSEQVSFNTALTGSNNPLPGSNNLKFEVIEIKKEGEVEVEANGEEMAEEKASGTITIYNNFSRDTQRLITRTRFETANGLIFRIAESITVPGMTSSGPGVVDAQVYADEAGEKYNISNADFTIPGFKSDPARYKGFTAKSKTAMEGGFIGKIKKVAEADKKAAISELQNSLQTDLEKELGAKIPEDFVSLSGSTIYEYRDLGQGESSGSKAILKSEATAFIVVFDKHSLASSIAKQYLSTWGEIPVEIREFNGMTISFDPGVNIGTGNIPSTIPVKISGNATVFAAINGIQVAESLKGLQKTDLNSVMTKFPGVSSAKASIRPLWKSTFPSDTSKIHINVE